MPEEIKTPKTIEEQGVYIAWIFSDLREIKDTLKNSVGRVEFDDHVIWGQAAAKNADERLKKLEKIINNESLSLMHRIGTALDKKIVGVIVTLIIGTVGWSIYMSLRYQNALNNLPQITIKEQ